MNRKWIFCALTLLIVGCKSELEKGTIISEEVIFDTAITPFQTDFKPLASVNANTLFLTKLSGLYRMPLNTEPTLVYQFNETVQGVIELQSGTILVSTDAHHKDPTTPNVIWRSTDGGAHFNPVLTIQGGTIFSWSFTESDQNSVFAAEYGPQKKGMAKTLWRSDDDGQSWQPIFIAEDKEGTHLHRVEKDPFTGDIWLTQGDDDMAMLYRSQDNGDNWQEIIKSQATDFVFTQDYLYLGEDTDRVGRIGRLTKSNLHYEPNWFQAADHGNYAGSVYALSKTIDNKYLIMANMKYEYEDHIAALIKISMPEAEEVKPLLHLKSIAGMGQGLDIGVGPLCDGSIYWPGWKYSDASGKTNCSQ